MRRRPGGWAPTDEEVRNAFKPGCRSEAAVPLLRLDIRIIVPDGFVVSGTMVKAVRLRVKPGGATIPFLRPFLLASSFPSSSAVERAAVNR